MNDVYSQLKELIDDDEQRDELECRKYLQYVKDFLMKETPVEYEYVETEYPGNPGKSDYIISGKIFDSGALRVHAYLWELKAPQCHIFQKDTENRLKPSEYLNDAQNKLLHYFDNLRTNEASRQDFGVMRSNHVHLGGIIIGREKTKVTGEFNPPEKVNRLYQRAIDALRILYNGCGIKLVTWNQILDQLKPIQLSDKIETPPITTIVATTIEPSTVTVTTLPPFTHKEDIHEHDTV